MTRSAAIATAARYRLQGEVIYCMDHLGMEPAEALAEWDILQIYRRGMRNSLLLITHILDTSSALGQGRTIINKKDEKDILSPNKQNNNEND